MDHSSYPVRTPSADSIVLAAELLAATPVADLQATQHVPAVADAVSVLSLAGVRVSHLVYGLRREIERSGGALSAERMDSFRRAVREIASELPETVEADRDPRRIGWKALSFGFPV